MGLDNYVRLFTKDREFWNSMAVTLKYTFITVPGKVVLALIIAVILNRNLKGINFIRTVYYIPPCSAALLQWQSCGRYCL